MKTHKNTKSTNCVVAVLFILLLHLGGAYNCLNCIYITLNRDSNHYCIVKGDWNRKSYWGTRPIVKYKYEGQNYDLRSSSLILLKHQLCRIEDEQGCIPVCVDQNEPGKATVYYKLTWYGVLYGCYFVFVCLASLAYLWYKILRKDR